MQNWKNIIIKCSVFFPLLLVACSPQENKGNNIEKTDFSEWNTENVWFQDEKTIVGNALGTTFLIKTADDSLLILPQDIEQLFSEFNAELSTYQPNSLISRFNEIDTVIDLNQTKYFQKCFETSQRIYAQTYGNFDPTVYPLVNIWGFIKKINRIPTEEEIDSVRAFVGFEEGKLYDYENGILSKKDSRFHLVFNAIAKGQSVDEIYTLLLQKGQQNFYVEVGGEIRVKGLNDRKMKWLIGVDEPVVSNSGLDGAAERPLENYIELTDKSMATSGNYRDFYVLDGKEYSHTISPILGKPVKSNILSATVIANDVATADAYATAFMVMGVDSSLALLKNNPEIEVDAYLLYEEENGRIARTYSRGMLKYLMER